MTNRRTGAAVIRVSTPAGPGSLTAARALSGALITQKSMLAEMQAAGGPHWNFERELNRAVGAALPGEQYATITRQAISSYPSKDGLRVAVDQCAAYACAAGVVNATIPWDRLIAPDADMSFLPNQWGH